MFGRLQRQVGASVAKFQGSVEGYRDALVILPLQMLSGGTTPVESQPDWLQVITFFLPSWNFVSFAQAIIYRGAGFDIVWPEFVAVTGLGFVFFLFSLALFRRSIAVST